MDAFFVMFFVTTQYLVAVAAGEVALRYLVWWYMVQKEDNVLLSPMLLAISSVCGAIFAFEVYWMAYNMYAISSVHATNEYNLIMPAGYKGLSIISFFGFLGLCTMSYPMVLFSNWKNKTRQMLEMFLRCYLMIASLLAGMECLEVYKCLILKTC